MILNTWTPGLIGDTRVEVFVSDDFKMSCWEVFDDYILEANEEISGALSHMQDARPTNLDAVLEIWERVGFLPLKPLTGLRQRPPSPKAGQALEAPLV